MGTPHCRVERLGLVPYVPTWEYQRRLARARRDGALAEDVFLLVQHPHTYTMGRRAKPEHMLLPPEALEYLDVGVHAIDRGGDVTYHGPGQLVGYPIVALDGWRRDIRQHMRNLEEVVIRTLGKFNVEGGRVAGLSGVWIGNEKIAAVGVRVAAWVTTHGFALNVDPDLTYFSHIIPCGIRDREVTSMAKVLGKPPSMLAVEDSIVAAFGDVFGFDVRECDPYSAGGTVATRSDVGF